MTQEQIEKYLEQEQKEVKTSLWDNEITFKPYLLKTVFGDGMKLIYFGTLDDRPYWWLVRVDSSAKIDYPCEFDSEEIYQEIEEECGGYVLSEEEDNEGCYGAYPMIVSDSCAFWGLVADLEKGVDKYGIPLFAENN